MIVHPAPIPAVRINPRTGLPEINPDRLKAQAWVQGTAQNAAVSLTANGTAEDTIRVDPGMDGYGDCEFTHFTSDHLAAYRAELYVGGMTDKKLMNVPIHVDMLAAPGTMPMYDPVPLFVESKNAIAVRYYNLAATLTTNSVRLCAHGTRFSGYKDKAERDDLVRRAAARREWPFWLGLDNTSFTLAANATATRQLLTMSSDGDLEIEYLLCKSQSPFRLRVNESASGRPIFNGGGANASFTGVQSTHVVGNGLYVYRFVRPMFIRRQTIVEAFFDEILGASNLIEMCFFGRVIDYPEGKPDVLPRVAPEVAVPQPPPGLLAGGVGIPVTPQTATPHFALGGGPRWLRG